MHWRAVDGVDGTGNMQVVFKRVAAGGSSQLTVTIVSHLSERPWGDFIPCAVFDFDLEFRMPYGKHGV